MKPIGLLWTPQILTLYSVQFSAQSQNLMTSVNIILPPTSLPPKWSLYISIYLLFPFFNYIALTTITGKGLKPWSSSLCNILLPFTSALLGPNILLANLCSQCQTKFHTRRHLDTFITDIDTTHKLHINCRSHIKDLSYWKQDELFIFIYFWFIS
jgi:hypothetical protein